MTYQSRWNWLVLLGLRLSGALVRQYFVLRQKGANPVWLPAARRWSVALPGVDAAPEPTRGRWRRSAGLREVQTIVASRCVSCHAARPTQRASPRRPRV